MTYIFLVAGKGSRLHPLTISYPKTLYKLDKDTTILKRMIDLLKSYDSFANIVLVSGFMKDKILKEVEDVNFIYNPFYSVTNSIASLWFAREYLDCDNVVIINGDVVVSEKLVNDIICKPVTQPTVLIDSSIKMNADYKVQLNNDKVVIMSKDLDEYYGEYAGITKLDKISATLLKNKIEQMVENGFYDQWYENALVEMIFQNDFDLYYKDIYDYDWTEVDCVSDLIFAKKIHLAN